MLPSQAPYKEHEVVFVEDPCAEPIPGDVEKALALQARLASLLLPPGVQEPLTGEPLAEEVQKPLTDEVQEPLMDGEPQPEWTYDFTDFRWPGETRARKLKRS